MVLDFLATSSSPVLAMEGMLAAEVDLCGALDEDPGPEEAALDVGCTECRLLLANEEDLLMLL